MQFLPQKRKRETWTEARGGRSRHGICLFEPNSVSDRETPAFGNEHRAVTLFSRERSSILSFLILVLGINEIPRETLLHFKHQSSASHFPLKNPLQQLRSEESNSNPAEEHVLFCFYISWQNIKVFRWRFNFTFVSVLFWGESVWKPQFINEPMLEEHANAEKTSHTDTRIWTSHMYQIAGYHAPFYLCSWYFSAPLSEMPDTSQLNTSFGSNGFFFGINICHCLLSEVIKVIRGSSQHHRGWAVHSCCWWVANASGEGADSRCADINTTSSWVLPGQRGHWDPPTHCVPGMQQFICFSRRHWCWSWQCNLVY